MQFLKILTNVRDFLSTEYVVPVPLYQLDDDVIQDTHDPIPHADEYSWILLHGRLIDDEVGDFRLADDYWTEIYDPSNELLARTLVYWYGEVQHQLIGFTDKGLEHFSISE